MERPARNLPPPRLLPWRSWGEWRRVAAVLLGEPPVLDSPPLGDGVAVELELRRWVARGRAPLAIHSTLQLRALLAQCSDSMEGSAEDALRLSLSMAIVRVVNGFTDSGQGGAYARSVYEVASRIGLPRPLVDLRHESSHGALPSLSLLRFCARLTLGWLLEAYWRRQSQHLLGLAPLLHPSSLPPAGPDAPACADGSAREEAGVLLAGFASFDPAQQQPLPSPPLRIRTSAARRLLSASGGSGKVAAPAGAAAEVASKAPKCGGGLAFPAPVDFSAAVAAQQGDALAAYGMVAASWSLSSGTAPSALYAAARAVASLLAAQASSPAGSAAELRVSFVVPLMRSRCPGAPHPSSGEGAAWRGGAPPLLLLEQCAAADPGSPAETALLSAWLPALCLFQASWPVFGASLAAAATDVVLWGADAALEPLVSSPGAAGSSADRTRLARAALRILELLSSSRWSEAAAAAAATHAAEQQELQQPQPPSGDDDAGATGASSVQPTVGAWPRVTAQFTRQTPWQPAPPDALMGLPAPTCPPARRRGRDAAGPASWARSPRSGRGGHRRHGAEAAAAASTFSALCRLAHSLHVVATLCPLLDSSAGPVVAGLGEDAAAVAALRSDALALCSACGVRLATVARSAALSVLVISPPAAALVAGEEGAAGASLDASASGSSSGPAPACEGAARAGVAPGSSSPREEGDAASGPAEADLLLREEGGDAGRASAGGAPPEYSCDPSLAAMEALLGIRG